jgi:hypothetical protein
MKTNALLLRMLLEDRRHEDRPKSPRKRIKEAREELKELEEMFKPKEDKPKPGKMDKVSKLDIFIILTFASIFLAPAIEAMVIAMAHVNVALLQSLIR